MSELGALGTILAISPSSELGIVHRFFYGLLILQEKFCQNFIIFLNRLDRSPKFQFRQNAWEQVRIQSTWAAEPLMKALMAQLELISLLSS